MKLNRRGHGGIPLSPWTLLKIVTLGPLQALKDGIVNRIKYIRCSKCTHRTPRIKAMETGRCENCGASI